MKKHQKRRIAPKSWGVPKKGTKYLVKSKGADGIPILILVRDLLGLARSAREVKKALNSKGILLNKKQVTDKRNSAFLFDVLTDTLAQKNYRISLDEKGKYFAKEISEKESMHKVSKIADKKILRGKKVQLNLSDGRNYLYEKDCKVNDSALVDFIKKEVVKILPLEKGKKVFVFTGKYAGNSGEVEDINLEDKSLMIKTENDKIQVLIKQAMVIEK